MLSLHEFSALSNVSKSEYLRTAFVVSAFSKNRRKKICGAGINDADYLTQPSIDSKRVTCPAYRVWVDMLRRACDQKFKAKWRTYANVTVSNEWHSFMTFRKWWMENQVDGYQLDKDLLKGYREYSHESCIFVPSWLNNFTVDCSAARGDSPIGVHQEKESGKYRAECSHPFGQRKYLGRFADANEAYAAWRGRKLEIAAELKTLMDEIDARIYPRIIKIIENAK